MRKGLLVEAEKKLQLSLLLSRVPGFNPPAHNSLGLIYMENGALDKAEQSFLLSVQQKNNYATPYHSLGILYRKQGFPDRAMNASKKH